MTDAERLSLAASVIEEFRPLLQRDGGDIELLSFEANKVKVRLSGACLHCGMAGQTLGGIRRRLMGVLDTPVMVIPHG